MTETFSSNDANSSRLPARLGEYRLIREVGRGGMGIVYEAVQESLGRRVALKVLPAGLASQGAFLERFRREARIAGQLHHSNIVPVHGVGEHEGSHFYAMQFIEGQSLDAVIQDIRRLRGQSDAAEVPATNVGANASQVARSLLGGLFPEEDFPPAVPAAPDDPGAALGREELLGRTGSLYYRAVARLGRQAAEALAYAHSQGVLHRDVKPSNLLIDWHGTLWVTDFGLAKADDAVDLTTVDALVGTLRYMPPERFGGRADPRSDVYALGATLYELMTLRPAFDHADRVQLMAQITQTSPSSPRRTAPDAPKELATIVLKAIAREPADRYPTAAAMADDLRRFLEDRPIRARRASLAERLWRWRRRSPTVAALTLSTAALLILLAAGSALAAVWFGWDRDEAVHKSNDLAAANGLLVVKNDALEKMDAEKTRLGRKITDELWTSLYLQAQAGRYGLRPGRRLDSLKALQEAWRIRPGDRLRTEAIACLALADARPAPGREWNWPADASALAFAGDLSRYARGDDKGRVSVRRTDADEEIAHIDTEFGGPLRIELSSDGRFAAIQPHDDGGRLEVWDVEGTPRRRIKEASGVGCVAFSAQGQWLAVVFKDGAIALSDLTTDEPARKIAGRPGCQAAALDADAAHLAVSDEEFVSFYDLKTEAPPARWRTPSPMESISWGSDGLLATAGRDRRIYVWDVITHKQKAALEGLTGGEVRVAFNRAGDALASRDSSGMLRLWDPHGGPQLFSTPCEMRALRFGPDDRLLAAEVDAHKLRMWQVACAREYHTLTAGPGPAPEFSGSAAINKDGRLLAAATADGVRLWDLTDGDPCGFLPAGPAAAVAFDADGALLINGSDPKAGVSRWPILAASDSSDELTIGPPEQWPLRGAGAGMDCSRDGQTTAVAAGGGVLVRLSGHPSEPITLPTRDDDEIRDVAVSPDGRWVAACSHDGKGVHVWEVSKRAVVLEVKVDGASRAVFSPDGKWLAAGGKNDCHLWAVGSWQKGPAIEGAASAFSPDGAMLAVESVGGVVRLMDADSGKEYARLTDPNRDRGEVYFTPDGARLAVVSREGRCIHVWDLRLIRQELAERGLDWERPPLAPAPAAVGRLQVTVAAAPRR